MSNTYTFIRHGATEFNRRGILIGGLDVPLSAAGMRQALALRDSLGRMEFDAVCSSPLLRAYHTATIALAMAAPTPDGDESPPLRYVRQKESAPRLPITIDARLSERSFGELEGVPRDGFADRFPHYAGRAVTMSFSDRPDGGESFNDIERRMRDFLVERSRLHENAHIAVFSHNGPIRVARKILLGLSEAEALRFNSPHCEPISLQG